MSEGLGFGWRGLKGGMDILVVDSEVEWSMRGVVLEISGFKVT
jgi:hypothetical protein